MYATEAKVKALQDLNIIDTDSYNGHIHRYPNDWPYTARDETIAFIGSGTSVEKGIRQMVYRAIKGSA